MSHFPVEEYERVINMMTRAELTSERDTAALYIRCFERQTKAVDPDDVDTAYRSLRVWRRYDDAVKRVIFCLDGVRHPKMLVPITIGSFYRLSQYISQQIIFEDDDEVLYRMTWGGR